MLRPAKSGCSRSMPVSSTATLMPCPVKPASSMPMACRPQLKASVSSNNTPSVPPDPSSMPRRPAKSSTPSR